ncbi:MAG: hypothetical protein IT392_06185 [Nitrospirae bacterium]|nr:hypothetical protein [Nitrospirota bacterium]
MSSISNIQQIISNIAGIDRVQHTQQQHVHSEQARYASEGQKSAEVKGKKIEENEPADSVEISVRDDQKGSREDSGNDNSESDKEDNPEESSEDRKHVDLIV